MKRILLVGNPNVGKSAVFSRLTGAKVVISNYPGSTVEFSQGSIKLGSEQALVIDVPGTYSLEPTSKAETVAVEMLKQGDVVINILDATNLERNLHLTLQLLEKHIPVVIALNLWDEARHKGIKIDAKKLEENLGVPVVPVCGLTGEGIKDLVVRIFEAKESKFKIYSDDQRWEMIGRIITEVQNLTHRHHTFLERLEDITIRPLTGLPISLIIIYCAFWAIRFISESMISYLLEPVFEKLWLPLMIKLSVFLGEGSLLHHILIGNLIDGTIDFGQSFGVLTTGLFVPIAMVLPYILSFYLILGILEDFGYLPRLAVLMDNFMHYLGLHGYSIIPMMLCLGCKVPGLLAIRILEEKREKFIAAALMAVAIPCTAQSAMIVGLVGERGGRFVLLIFAVLFGILFIKGLLLNKILKGASPEILIEIPPYRIPQINAVFKKLWMRVQGFLKEALPLVLLGVLFVNILYVLKIIDLLSFIFTPVLKNVWGLPDEAISALVVGFLRKDIAIGMLGPLNLTTKQLVIASTVLSVYFPCIATFIVLIRELGVKDMVKIIFLMLSISLLVGMLLNFIL